MSNKPILKTPHHGTVADRKAIEAARDCATTLGNVPGDSLTVHIYKSLSLPQLFAIVEALEECEKTLTKIARPDVPISEYPVLEKTKLALTAYHTAQKENREGK